MKWFTNWFRGAQADTSRGKHHQLTSSRRHESGKRSPLRFRLECLEDRTVPTTGWATAVGTSISTAMSVALDSANSAVYTAGTEISKYTSDGSLLWSKSLGGSASQVGYNIAVDAAGDVYASGIFKDTLT